MIFLSNHDFLLLSFKIDEHLIRCIVIMVYDLREKTKFIMFIEYSFLIIKEGIVEIWVKIEVK